MKKLIIWGNCQTAGIAYVFQRLPEVKSRWEVRHHELWAKEEVLAENLKDFDDCDVLLLQDLSNWKTHPKCNELHPDTRIVRFPFCYFAAIWPFDGHQNGRDPAWCLGERDSQFAFQDHLLGRLRTLEANPEQRYIRYRRLDVEGVPDIGRYARFEEARLRQNDRRLGTSIGQTIIDNYRETRLFHAITHPVGSLMVQLVNEIATKLELPAPDLQPFDLDYLGYCQVPVHPKVIEQLGLSWVDENTTYNFHNRERLTFEEYTRRYIRVYG